MKRCRDLRIASMMTSPNTPTHTLFIADYSINFPDAAPPGDIFYLCTRACWKARGTSQI
jgi:hypothetical protein